MSIIEVTKSKIVLLVLSLFLPAISSASFDYDMPDEVTVKISVQGVEFLPKEIIIANKAMRRDFILPQLQIQQYGEDKIAKTGQPFEVGSDGQFRYTEAITFSRRESPNTKITFDYYTYCYYPDYFGCREHGYHLNWHADSELNSEAMAHINENGEVMLNCQFDMSGNFGCKWADYLPEKTTMKAKVKIYGAENNKTTYYRLYYKEWGSPNIKSPEKIYGQVSIDGTPPLVTSIDKPASITLVQSYKSGGKRKHKQYTYYLWPMLEKPNKTPILQCDNQAPMPHSSCVWLWEDQS